MQELTLQQENRNRVTAFFISIFVYGGILLLLFFLELLYQPKTEDISGDSVNFGMDLVGMGNINTTNKANPSKNNYDVKPADKKEIEKVKTKPVVKEVPPTPVEKTKPTKVKVTPEKIVTTKDEKSPVTVKENTKDEKVVKPTVKTPPVVAPKPAPTPAPPAPKPERKVDEGATMKKGGGSNGTSGTRDGVGGASDGNDKAGTGNKGRPDGTTEAIKFEGKGGNGKGGGGAGDGVSLSGFGGWSKRKMTIPQDASNETGKIVFSIIVDDTGNVISINKTSGTTISSNTVINYYKEHIRNNLSKFLIAEGSPPPRANGTITINIEN